MPLYSLTSDMARNAEKAMTMLSRWVRYKKNLTRLQIERPSDPRECTEVWKGDKWRQDIIKDITLKVTQIQNAGLGEYRIRDLNDEINRLVKEKEKWEAHIFAIGGPDYSKTNPKVLDADGKELPSNRGYKYFGAARDLPGVRELFEQEPQTEKKKTRADLYKRVDAHYFGYLDEEDDELIELEAVGEKKARELMVEQWKNGVIDDLAKCFEVELATFSEDDDDLVDERERASRAYYPTDNEPDGSASIVVPSQKEIEDMLIEHKRKELLKRYVSETLSAQHEESKALLGL